MIRPCSVIEQNEQPPKQPRMMLTRNGSSRSGDARIPVGPGVVPAGRAVRTPCRAPGCAAGMTVDSPQVSDHRGVAHQCARIARIGLGCSTREACGAYSTDHHAPPRMPAVARQSGVDPGLSDACAASPRRDPVPHWWWPHPASFAVRSGAWCPRIGVRVHLYPAGGVDVGGVDDRPVGRKHPSGNAVPRRSVMSVIDSRRPCDGSVRRWHALHCRTAACRPWRRSAPNAAPSPCQ